MAIDRNTQAPDPTLRKPHVTVAAVGSLVLALGVMAALAIMLATQPTPSPQAPQAGLTVGQQVVAVGWFVGMGAVGVMAAYLLAGRRSVAFVLMAIWMIIAAAGVLAAFTWLLGAAAPLGFSPAWGLVTVLLAILPPSVIVALLIAAIPHATRSRYGSMVGVSVVLAVTVVIVLNMISFEYGFDKDFEQLGRFGLSERGRDIVRQVDTPTTLSVVYNTVATPGATDEDRARQETLAERLDRVNELLAEIHRVNPQIDVVDASGDAARTLLMTRLRERQLQRTGKHRDLLMQLRGRLPELKQALDTQQTRWQNLPEETYIAQWRLGSEVADVLAQLGGALRQIDRDIRDDIDASPLPNHVDLLEKITATLQQLRDTQQQVDKRLEQIAQIPPAVQTAAPEINRLIERLVESARQAQTLVGKDGDPAPANPPAETLGKVADVLGQAAIRTRNIIAAIKGMTEDEDVYGLLAISSAWRSDSGLNLTGRLELIARQFDDFRARLAVMIQDANEAALKRELTELRKPLARVLIIVTDTQTMASTALATLQQVDKTSEALFQAARQGQALGPLSTVLEERISPLLDEAASLDAPAEEELPEELTQQNIVIIEMGDELRVLTFKDVWPSFANQADEAGSDATRRFFNGDAAIAATLLDLTHEEPFARVLLTYASTPVPAGIDPRRFPRPQLPIAPESLRALRGRLEDANFDVAEWDLANPMPASSDAQTPQPFGPAPQDEAAAHAGDAASTIPTILLVLPPAPMQQWQGVGPVGGVNETQLGRLRQAIDNGASAIFLSMFIQPGPGPMGLSNQMNYAWNRYLQADWGLQAHTDQWVISGVPSDTRGMYRLSPKFYFLECTDFDTNPVADRIGGPLRGRHMIWQYVCPVTWQDELPQGVEVEPLLTVPATNQHIWAVGNFQALAEQLNQFKDEIRRQPDQGDRLPPITLAAVATRTAQDDTDKAPARLVVLGMGDGMSDMVLTRPTYEMSDRGLRVLDPPHANPELIVNSCYWLIGREQYILAGAMGIGPVEPMSETTQNVLAAIGLLVLPLGVLLVGGLVHLARRRS